MPGAPVSTTCPGLCGRVGLDDDSVDFSCPLEIVLPGDRKSFGIGAGLDSNDGVGTGAIERRLNRGEAGRLTGASRVGTIDVKNRLRLRGCRDETEKRHEEDETDSATSLFHHRCLLDRGILVLKVEFCTRDDLGLSSKIHETNAVSHVRRATKTSIGHFSRRPR